MAHGPGVQPRRCSEPEVCCVGSDHAAALNWGRVLRLKELETLERVAERIDRISVFGGLDQVLNGLVSINKA
jgi:hypothetical protein